MIVFSVGEWFVQFGIPGGRWSVEAVKVEYDGFPEKWHRVWYFGPFCLSVENDE